MNQPYVTPRGGRLSREEELPLAAVILYHDVSSASKAAGLLSRLTGQLAGEVDVDTTFWSFDVLRLPAVAELAMERFAEADLIVVSSDSIEPLPPHASRCVETAMERRDDNPLAVAALICAPDEAEPNSPLCAQLRRICCRNEGDSFFFSRDWSPAEHGLTREEVCARARASSPVLDSIMQRPLSHDPYRQG